MSTPLTALLQIIQQPNHPAFAQALAQVLAFPLPTLPAAQLPQVLAQLDTAINSLRQQQQQTAAQLQQLRQQVNAQQAYQTPH